MSLLEEYALTPDVFDQTHYSSGEVAGIHLQHLKEVLLQEAIIRNLRNGEWKSLFQDNTRPWHKYGKELLKKLVSQNRLNPFPARLPSTPTSDIDWCREGLETHSLNPLTGIISTSTVSDQFSSDPIVASIDRLSSTPWWTGRSPSIRLTRNISSYLESLDLVLIRANSIMFIDPHLDPTRQGYGDFIQILTSLGSRSPKPKIEIHRVCYEGSGSSRRILLNTELEQKFKGVWLNQLQTNGLAVEIFIWDDFHDRHIISDLLGIHAGNGFDTIRNLQSKTTWSRLGRKERDDIQREFDPASNRHTLRSRFSIPD